MPFEGAEGMDTNNIAFAAASEWQAVGHQRGLDLYEAVVPTSKQLCILSSSYEDPKSNPPRLSAAVH